MCWVLCSLLPLLSIHGVSGSCSPRFLSDFKFKLCVLYVSPDGKISLYPGRERLCPVSSSAGLAPGPLSWGVWSSGCSQIPQKNPSPKQVWV